MGSSSSSDAKVSGISIEEVRTIPPLLTGDPARESSTGCTKFETGAGVRTTRCSTSDVLGIDSQRSGACPVAACSPKGSPNGYKQTEPPPRCTVFLLANGGTTKLPGAEERCAALPCNLAPPDAAETGVMVSVKLPLRDECGPRLFRHEATAGGTPGAITVVENALGAGGDPMIAVDDIAGTGGDPMTVVEETPRTGDVTPGTGVDAIPGTGGEPILSARDLAGTGGEPIPTAGDLADTGEDPAAAA